MPGRGTGPKLAAFDPLAGRHLGASSNHGAVLDHGPIHHCRPHADKGIVANSTGMENGRMADGNAGTDESAQSGRTPDPPRRYVDNGPILDVGALADTDFVDVSTEDDREPDAAIRPDLDIANNSGRGGNKNIFRGTWQDSPVGHNQAGHSIIP